MATTTAIPPTARRRAFQVVFRLGTVLGLLFVIGPAIWLVLSVVIKALAHFKLSVLTHNTVGTSGGLENAIIGTLVLMAGVLIVAGGIGVLAGLHLSEFARPRRSGKASFGVLRTASDVLSGFPSIVLGYVGYVALVVGLGWGFSLLPAVLILSIMVIPYIAKSTETALRQVPTSYREGAEALGMSGGYALRKVILKTALPGIVTGLLIALAISGGETAPLIYTAGAQASSTVQFSLIHHAVPYLTYLVFTDFNQPQASAHYLANDAAFVLVVLVLILLVAARLIVRRSQRFGEGRR
jgi:phosphate transport system permease protein